MYEYIYYFCASVHAHKKAIKSRFVRVLCALELLFLIIIKQHRRIKILIIINNNGHVWTGPDNILYIHMSISIYI